MQLQRACQRSAIVAVVLLALAGGAPVAAAPQPGRSAATLERMRHRANIRWYNWKNKAKRAASDRIARAKGKGGLALTRLALAARRAPAPFREHVLAEMKRAVDTQTLMGIASKVELTRDKMVFSVWWNQQKVIEKRTIAVERGKLGTIMFTSQSRPFQKSITAWEGRIATPQRSGGFRDQAFGTNHPQSGTLY